MPYFTGSPPIDRSILCCCCIIDLGDDSGHSTESTGHLQLLSRKYLSDCFQPESVQHFPPFFSTPILSTNVCCLGQFTLVLELGDQSYLCSARDFAAAMGTKIPQGHSATIQSTQASADPCILFRRG